MNGYQVELVPYDPQWPILAQAEIENLRAVFGNVIHNIHHIGSTAVPGLSAKSTIDLLAEVDDLEDVVEVTSRLESIRYISRGENGIPGRLFFVKSDTEEQKRIAHLHCFKMGDPRIAQHLKFRDLLIAKPEIAREYEAVKQQCLTSSGGLSTTYQECKSEWISSHTASQVG